jgi:UDP-N-acetylglucosamine--N-acetylmuramyl-(pentapeptide) pyrophosphoryl-undecaprenol N-acetylglucosamine transferase
VSRRAALGIAFLGGGTGGHIYPSLAVAEAVERLEPDSRAVFITGDRPADQSSLEGQLVFGHAAVRVEIGARPPSLKPPAMLRCVRAWGQAVRDSRKALRELRSSCDSVVALSTGGYVSAPAAQAARVERVPLVLVSLDARIGKANRFISKRAGHRLVAQNDGPRGWEAIGPIVGNRAFAPATQPECRRMLGLEPDLPTLLIMGGSQGATSINAFMSALCEASPDALEGWQVLHLAGDARAAADARAAYEAAGVQGRVLERQNPIGPAWGAADLALCRSGAGTVAEAHTNGVPAIFLPYPFHRDQHQAANAQPLVDAGGAVLLEDKVEPAANLEAIAPTLRELLGSSDRRSAMARALEKLPRKDGASACARVVVNAAKNV